MRPRADAKCKYPMQTSVESADRFSDLVTQLVSGALPRRKSAATDTHPPHAVSTILYLGAVGRSGTTLIERAIATSPSFVSLGEMVHLWHRGLILNERCGCGQPFRDRPFWTAVAQRAYGGWAALDLDRIRQCKHEVDRNRFIPWLIWPRRSSRQYRASLDEFASILDRLYTAIGDEVGADVILVDASKHPSYLFVLRRLRLHRPRLLHVVRDPCGVAFSWSNVVVRPEATGDDMERLGTFRASARWVSHNLLFQLAGWLHVKRQRLDYERFANDPTELGRVVGQLTVGLAPTLPTFDGTKINLGLNHTVSGNPMRFTSGEIEVRSDQRWRSAMPRIQRILVGVLTFPVRISYR